MTPSKLLFHLPCEPKLDKVYDPHECVCKIAIVIGFDIYMSSQKPQGVEAVAEVTEHGPYIVAVKKFRDVEIDEVMLKR